jgi:hypothetical protein
MYFKNIHHSVKYPMNMQLLHSSLENAPLSKAVYISEWPHCDVLEFLISIIIERLWQWHHHKPLDSCVINADFIFIWLRQTTPTSSQTSKSQMLAINHVRWIQSRQTTTTSPQTSKSMSDSFTSRQSSTTCHINQSTTTSWSVTALYIHM